MSRFRSYREFWPYYLGEHRRRATRWLHFAGTTAAVACIAAAAFWRAPWLLPIGPLIGYGSAWLAHMFVEKNRPATFTYPIYSLIADFHMYALMATGRLQPHLDASARGGTTSGFDT